VVDICPSIARRPRPDLVERVACPPYDVLSLQEARDLAAGNPYSFLHVIRAEIGFPTASDPHSDEVYQAAGRNLQNLVDQGVLIRDDTACFYVYRLVQDGHTQTGLMAGASVDEYEQDRIKKHESTRPDKQADRARHIQELSTNTGPVLLAYRARDEIDNLVKQFCAGNEPVYDFTADDGVSHTLWVMAAPGDIARLREAFRQVESLYIADGHHRAAAATQVRRRLRNQNPQHNGQEAYNYFLAAAFPANQLRILGYHRVVRDLAGLEPEAFLERVAEKFECLPADGHQHLPQAPRQFGMLVDGRWYHLAPRNGTYPQDDPVASLDAAILQNNLLGPVLGIHNPRADDRIDFVGGSRGVAELERRCRADMRVAFSLYPMSLDQLMAVADAGREMPPKSTWFEPKLRSGLVIRRVDGRNL